MKMNKLVSKKPSVVAVHGVQRPEGSDKQTSTRMCLDPEILTRISEVSLGDAAAAVDGCVLVDTLVPSSKQDRKAGLFELVELLHCGGYNWTAAAIARYLLGEFRSLDEAFGLSGKRGRPKKTETLARDVEVVERRLLDHSWKQIAHDARVPIETHAISARASLDIRSITQVAPVAAPRTKPAPWCTRGVGANCTHRTTLYRRVVRGARG
jgi:hypothetical protein